MKATRLLSLAVFLVAGAGSQTAPAQPSPPMALIRAQLNGLRSDSGNAACLLFGSADGFPTTPAKALQRRTAPIKDRAAVCVFDGVPPGTYAIAAIHDENGNGTLDKSTFGKPTEGVGASRDARPGFMRGPRFEDAAMSFGATTTIVPIAIHYF
jgi:uncharacterized protein (DUF2141 family)